jgi:Holliday junction resolvase
MLKYHNVWYYYPPANGMGQSGLPDVICNLNGLFVGIECKADHTKKPTALQLRCAEQIRAAHGYWFLVYDDISLGQVEQFLITKMHEQKMELVRTTELRIVMRDVTVVDRESKLWNHHTVEKIPVLQQYWKPTQKYEEFAKGEWRDVPFVNAVDIEL